MTTSNSSDEAGIREVLERWALMTCTGRQEEVLVNHAADALIYDVLPPMKYEGTKAYRDSWGEWQPETVGENVFELKELKVTAGAEVGFAHGFIRCGGVMPGGKRFEDEVRATFCLKKVEGMWRVVHQHISKSLGKGK